MFQLLGFYYLNLMSQFLSLSLQRSPSEYQKTDEIPIVLNYYYGDRKNIRYGVFTRNFCLGSPLDQHRPQALRGRYPRRIARVSQYYYRGHAYLFGFGTS